MLEANLVIMAAGFVMMYSQNRALAAKLAELRRVTDLQMDGLRLKFTQVEEALQWIEPHLRDDDFGGWTPARHTGLKTPRELHKAMESGLYTAAWVPWTRIDSTKP